MATATGIVPDVSPEEIGLDPARLERLERHLQRYLDAGLRIGALVVVSRGGRVGYVHARGLRDAEAGLPVGPDTIWRIYSMTKPITSVAAMTLWEEGRLSLDDPVAKYLPEFANPRVYRLGPAAAPVTVPASGQIEIRHLLTHTSGLTYSFLYRDQVDEAYRLAGLAVGGREEYTLADAVERVARLPLLFEPGSEWNYSYSTDVLGRVVEVVAGQPLERVFRERIFEPLGMDETGYRIGEEQAERLAALYSFDAESGRAKATPRADRPCTEPRPFLGGGHGLLSTAADYHRFMQMLLRGGELDGARLLSPRTVALMTSNHLPGGVDIPSFARPSVVVEDQAGKGFGLGFSVLVDPVRAQTIASPGTYGWGGAAGTDFWIDPAEELAMLFCTQVLWCEDDLRAELRRLAYQALVD
jgi:CubicO group peptidase (beta-lactamase class C family)